MSIETACQCKKSSLAVNGQVLTRFICHCKICQKVYQQPFADVVVVKSQDLTQVDESSLTFAKHKLPPAVNRGVCKHCSQPVLATLNFLPNWGYSFIPASNFDSAELPEPSMHLFYHRRVQDKQDSLPKHSGYWQSQLALVNKLVFTSN